MSRKKSVTANSDQLIEIAAGFQASKILFTAVEFEIFSILGKGGRTIEEIAGACKLPTRPLKRLLNSAAWLGLIRLKNAKYFNSPISMKYLVAGNPEYLGDLMIAYNRMLYEKWGKLDDVMRKDKFQPIFPRKVDAKGNISIDPEIVRRAMMAQHNYSVKPAQEVALNFDFSKYKMLLDLGGGSGILSVMAAKKNRRLKAMVFDYPPVCKIADEIISNYRLSRRVKTYPGNILKDSYPPGADVVLISGVLDGYNEKNCRMIIGKAYDYLPTGGAIVLKEAILNDNRIGPLFSVLFSVSLLIETEGGDARSRGEMTQWLKDAGFKRIKYKPLVKISGKFRNLGLLTAIK
jgi:hypothetical protein